MILKRILNVFFISLLLGLGSTALAGAGLIIKGRIKTLSPVTISVKTVLGKTLGSANISKSKSEFSIGPLTIEPDVYVLAIGKTEDNVYLTNTTVTINGFYDDNNINNNNLEFTGLEAHNQLIGLGFRKNSYDVVKPEQLKNLKGSQVSAIAYMYSLRKYSYLKPFYDQLTPQDFKSPSGKWMQKMMDSLSAYATGIPAPGFSFPTRDGEVYSLSQFKGKIVVVDCWASWCSPCRNTMNKIKAWYDEFKNDVQFISISVDDDKDRWLKAEKDENIPWLSLWDKAGFKSKTAGGMRTSYGFSAIPFIAIIDKEGKVLRRDIVDAAVLKKYLQEIIAL